MPASSRPAAIHPGTILRFTSSRGCAATNHALRTAKVYLFSGHLDGQLPFAAMSRRIQKTDAVIGQCQEWIAQNYGCANPVAAMAEHSGLNPRTFARRFRAATGYRPMDYVHALRIEEAKQFIESENIGIDEISLKVGYDDPASFAGCSSARPASRRRHTDGNSPVS